MHDGSRRGAEAHLAAARAARREIDLDGHARQTEKLEALIAQLPAGPDRQVLRWAAAAERLRDVGYVVSDDDELREAARQADQILGELGRDRPDIAARLRLALAQVAARLHSPMWVKESTLHHVAAARLFIEGGEAEEAAATLVALAWTVHLPMGQLRAAHSALTEGLSLAEHPSIRAAVLAQRAQLHLWLGELDRAQSDIDAAWPLAQLGDDRGMAYVAWAAATAASLRGQRSAVEAWVALADRRRGAWADGNVTGLWYEAAVIDALARVGAVDAARERLAALMPQREREPTATGLAQVAFEARCGDRAKAAAAWEAVRRRPDLEPWEVARLHLLLAAADDRAGIPAGPSAAEAFDLCAGLEQPAVLLTIEPEIARALLPAAAEAGSTVARRLLARQSPWNIRVLGTFEVRGPEGESVALTGRARRLVMYLAVSGEPVSRGHLAAWLWPAANDREWRRERLRRLLHRARSVVPGAIEALEDDRLRLSSDVCVDLASFTAAVGAARQSQDSLLRVVAVRNALGHLGGDLLPDEILDDDWLDPVRVRLTQDLTWVHTVVAEHEADQGHDELVIEHAQAALAAEPTNEAAAKLAIDALRRCGRWRDAQAVLRRSEEALEHLGVRPGQLLRAARARLERSSEEAD